MRNWLLFYVITLSTLFEPLHGQENENIILGDPSFTTKDGLISNSVYGGIINQEGFIYFYSDKGISKFDGHKFKNFTSSNGLPDNNVWLLSEDSRGRIWIFAHARYLSYLKNDSIFRVLEFPHSISVKSIEEKDSTLIFYDESHSFSLDINSLEYKYLKKFEGDYYKGRVVNKVCNYEDYRFYLTVNVDTIHYENLNTGVINTYSNKSGCYMPFKSFNTYYLNSKFNLTVIEKNGILKSCNLFSKYSLNRSFIDFNNDLWFCTKNNGVGFKRPITGYINYIKPNLEIVESQLVEGRLFLELSDNSMAIYNDTFNYLNQFRISKLKVFSFRKNEIICSLSDQFLSIFSSSVGKYKFSKINWINDIKSIGTPLGTLNISNDSLLYWDRLGRCYYINKTNVWKFKLIHDDSFRLKFAKYEKPFYFFITKEGYTIRDSVFNFVKEIGKDKYYYTEISCMLYNGNSKHYYLGTEENGVLITSDHINYISLNECKGMKIIALFFVKNKLVTHTNKGIFIFDLIHGIPKLVNSITGEQNIIPEEIIGVYPWKNKIAIVISNAIHHIDPDSIYNKEYHLKITEIIQDNCKLDSVALLKLQPDFSPISISMSLLDFQVANDVIYQYKLNNNEWQNIPVNTLDISDMASGFYNLNLQAINKYSNKVLATNNLKLRVLHPWYKSIWFILSSNVGLFWLLFWLYKKREDRKRVIEDSIKVLEHNLRESKIKVLENQMNPHFLFNSLTTIKAFILNSDIKNADYYLGYFSKLMRLYLDASRSSKISIGNEIELIRHYLILERMRFDDRFDYSIEIDPSIDLDEIKIPTMLIQPIVENSVKHGLFHRRVGGRLNLSIRKIYADLIIEIADNGIGIENSLRLKEQRSENRVSHATTIIKEKIDLLNSIQDYSIEMKISELFPTEDYYKGTKVEIILSNLL